jgi:hypothetical protein
MNLQKSPLRLAVLGALAASLTLGLLSSAHAQRVVRDAVTGQMRPLTASEAKMLEDLDRAMRSRVPRGLLTGTPNPKPIRMADGSDFLESTDADLNYSVVVRTADGRLVRQCVNNPDLAERIGRGELPAFARNFLERMNDER